MSSYNTPRTSYSNPSYPISSTTPNSNKSSTPSLTRSSSVSNPLKLNDFKRPPSSRSFRTGSPQPRQSRSRPGSAMGYLQSSGSTTSSSRPTTPSQRMEQYSGSITVSIRPNPQSLHPLHPSPWALDQYSNSISNKQDNSSFTFDNVFSTDEQSNNYYVYQKCCSQLVQSFLNDGYNATVFAYGMTGSGKTYSMRGDENDAGFVKLAIDDIFAHFEMVHSKQFKLTVSYLEIYNERIIDLLASNPNIATDLKIRDDAIYGNKIVGINSVEISSKAQLLELIRNGDNNRKTCATDFNARSSRSHAILQLKLNTMDLISNTANHATLSLCDLAGSERATSSAQRRKEGAFINKSLLALSTVINKLSIASSAQSSSSLMEHIPYRDSKLTRLLQPALSGSSLISVLCTIHLGSGGDTLTSNQQFISETYNTLRFAARARNIVMNVHKNKATPLLDNNSEAYRIIEDLKRTIERQNDELEILRNKPVTTGISSDARASIGNDFRIAELEAENVVLNEKLEHLARLTELQKTETIILKNDSLSDILGSDMNNHQMMMANLEEFYKRVNYEMDEYKAYINQLENQVKHQAQQLSLQGVNLNGQINNLEINNNNTNTNTTTNNNSNDKIQNVSNAEVEAILKEQEEEILYLKEMIKDKDHIIKGLTKTSKLRKLMESNSINTQDEPHLSHENSSDKENNYSDYKSFKIGSGSY